MVYIFCIIFALIIFLIIAFNYKQHDFFAPVVFYNLWTFVETVPRILEIKDYFSNASIASYFIIEILALIATNVGIILFLRKNVRVSKANKCTFDKSIKSMHRVSLAVFFVGVIARVLLIYSSGGLINVLSSSGTRTQLLAGAGYISAMGIFITFGMALYYKVFLLEKKYGIEHRKRKTNLIYLGFVLLTGGFLLSVFGNRAPLLETFMILIFVRNYCYKRITIRSFFNFRTFFLIVFGLLFMIMMPVLRSSENSDLFRHPIKWVQTSITNPTKTIFQEISTVSRDIFTFDYFSENDKWNGKVYLNIFVQPIPSTIYPNKPPMDDGMYLYNLQKGMTVDPNQSTSSLYYQTSNPFSSEGILFANFGLIGVVLGSIFIGYLYNYVYTKMRKSDFSIFMIITYQLVIYRFRLSTLHSLSTIIPILYMFLILYIFNSRLIIFDVKKTRRVR